MRWAAPTGTGYTSTGTGSFLDMFPTVLVLVHGSLQEGANAGTEASGACACWGGHGTYVRAHHLEILQLSGVVWV
eukprot:scaffold326602_cov37-Prasinocladus_malaysianus.AAC.1